MTFPYPLDPFQVTSLMHLHLHNHVFISAPTSSGKTLPAVYALKKSLDEGRKAVYTTPLKALSNQKYRDLSHLFGGDKVGLLTGDITLNPTAPVLICTTEILRSLLYRSSPVVRELGCAIFDEVHFILDPERGVVYEEVLMELPRVQCVFLSATVGNVPGFCDWVGNTTARTVAIVESKKRVVPLKVEGWWNGEFTEVVDSGRVKAGPKGQDGVVYQAKEMKNKSKDQRQERRFVQGSKSQYHSLIKGLQKRSYLPAIFFQFSKKRCDSTCDLVSGYVLNTAQESRQVKRFFAGVKARLSESDRALPQVSSSTSSRKATTLICFTPCCSYIVSNAIITTYRATRYSRRSSAGWRTGP